MNDSTVTLFGAPAAFGESDPALVADIKARIKQNLAVQGITVEWTENPLADDATRSEQRRAILRAYAQEIARA